MKDMDSCTLAEALVRWGEPTAATELTHLASKGCGGPYIPLFTPEKVDGFYKHQDLRTMLERELIQKLQEGTLVASGFASHAPLDAPMVTIPPDRWRSLVPNFDDSSAADAGVAIAGIVVRERDPATATTNTIRSTAEVGPTTRTGPDVGRIRLEIGRTSRRVRFDDTDLRLTPRSYDLLLILAEAAVNTGAPVSSRDIDARLWGVPVDKKAVNDAVGKLKNELMKQGIDEAAVRAAIENHRAKGYRLTLEPSEIHIGR